MKRVDDKRKTSGETHRISIIIPTLNEEMYVGRTLESIPSALAADCEIIVVDSSNNNATRRVVEEHSYRLQIKYYSWPVQDVATQRNIGAAAARHERLLFLDADTILGPGTLETCMRLNTGPIFVGSIRHVPDVWIIGTRIAMAAIYSLIFLAKTARLPVTNGDFLLTSQTTHEMVKGFREGFLLGEDTDYGLRVRRVGGHQVFIWRKFVIASARRLSHISPFGLVRVWASAYVRALRSGPTSRDSAHYPFGLWGTSEEI